MERICKWPGCDGVVGGDLLCDKAWHDQRREPPPPPPDAIDAGEDGEDGDTVDSRRVGHSEVGAGVVYVPPTPEIDPEELVQTNPKLPERVICTDCSRSVMRGDGDADDQSGRCVCGARYDFVPKLQPGELISDDRFEVVGVIDRGGQGWIYLAKDRKLKAMPCALKGRRHTENVEALEAEEAELEALAALSHRGIVKILNLVEHADSSGRIHRYIVMELIRGRSLEYRRRRQESAAIDVRDALAYLHAVMPALGYLHEHGWVFCDLKPDNMIPAGDAVTLIDVGAARRMDAKGGRVYGTPGYSAPEMERDRSAPSVASDIYAAGRTLAVLVCGSWRSWSKREDQLPPRDHPALRGRDCLWRLIARACAANPSDRFIDAEEMAEALLGVMSQVAAAVERTPKPYTSRRFGLPRPHLGVLDWRSLPMPTLPEQPSVRSLFSGLGGTDPRATISAARNEPRLSWADAAVLVRAHCAVGDPAAAERAAREIDPAAEGEEAVRGRTGRVVETAQQYLIGIAMLAQRAVPEAMEHLEQAYDMAPGEPACALALAAALEAGGQREWLVLAGDLYKQVAATDPTWVGAVAGHARVLEALHRPEEAAVTLTSVPELHPSRRQALTMACRSLTPDKYDKEVAEAAHALVPAEDQDSWSEREAELAAAFYTMSLKALLRDSDVELVGSLTTPDELADAAANALRKQARFTSTLVERHRLLDEAARIQPWRTWR